MLNTEKLQALFMQLPGIGPRQARRFVHFLLVRGKLWRKELITTINNLDASIAQCNTCMSYFETDLDNKNTECNICSNKKRDRSKLMVVLNDVDISQMEKSGQYNGLYFVLGSLLTLIGNKKSYARVNPLQKLITKQVNDDSLKEIIFALPATPEGEHTTDKLRFELRKIIKDTDIRMTVLGRGLSTGGEIEYIDPETLNHALKNRA